MSPTLLQLGRIGRKQKERRNKVPCLYHKPQKKALVFKLGILAPRKPNSAKRKHAKLRILGRDFQGRKTLAHIPG
jgi:small subunit ribosomal protein S12